MQNILCLFYSLFRLRIYAWAAKNFFTVAQFAGAVANVGGFGNFITYRQSCTYIHASVLPN